MNNASFTELNKNMLTLQYLYVPSCTPIPLGETIQYKCCTFWGLVIQGLTTW